MKKFLALILATVVVISSLAACGSSSTEDTSADASTDTETEADTSEDTATTISDDTLTIAGEGEFSALLPQYQESNPNSRGNILIWDTLVHYDSETGEISEGVATSWEWIDDTHIRFYIREGITFSDGTELTAEDVLYSFQEGQNYNLSGYYESFDTDNFEIEDDYTIVMALTTPYPQLLDVLGCTHYAIICKSAIEAAGGIEEAIRTPVSSGKYYLSEWVDGQYAVFERNDDYWDQDNLPYYKTIVYYFMDDASTRLMSVQSGEADMMISNTTAQLTTVDSDDSMYYIVEQQNNLLAVWYNCTESEALQDERVREAISLALDASGVNAVAFGGYATETSTVFPQSSNLYYEVDCDYREANLELAAELLEEAGYPNGEGLTLTLLCSTSSPENTEVVQGQLLELGIDAVVDSCEQADYLTKLRNGEYDLNVGMADSWDPFSILNRLDGRVTASTAQGGSRYQSDELYDLIDAAKAEMDEDARYEIYAEIQQFVVDNYICYPLSNYVRMDTLSSSVTGLTYDLRGWPDFSTVRAAE